MRTNKKTCIITGLKVDVMIINQEFVSNSLTSQFDAVQVTNKNILIKITINLKYFHLCSLICCFCYLLSHVCLGISTSARSRIEK